MIVLEQVSKRYRHRGADTDWFTAVAPLSLHIRAGEIFGLMGYSGAGKSTLLRLINLLERPDTGTVKVAGEELTALNAAGLRRARQHIGMVFQQFNLLANRTVADNVAFPLQVAGWTHHDIEARVAECLNIVGLADRAQHYPAQLSGGQKQRVGIARALAPSPKVILADEPTSALDPATTRSVLECLLDINQRFGVTIVIVTHEMSVIRRLCDRAALLHRGELLEVIDVKDNQIHAQSAIGQELVQED
ncbi:D-methionine transport system ATP-binding protein [Neisseria sp. HSC-16F19]|nr:methionine ABC transporter ATP-binding protein [Neisseria sp. HSC-16F19]MCP2039811.1 D-methionine transport system ATP-binding protein [Neisseria sp. HSC-16F19]